MTADASSTTLVTLMLRAPLGIDLIREEHSARNMLREKLLHLS
jgi:hypothetical protein